MLQLADLVHLLRNVDEALGADLLHDQRLGEGRAQIVRPEGLEGPEMVVRGTAWADLPECCTTVWASPARSVESWGEFSLLSLLLRWIAEKPESCPTPGRPAWRETGGTPLHFYDSLYSTARWFSQWPLCLLS